jgi:acetyltransferase-like isoleucine patch superfamily enzyme
MIAPDVKLGKDVMVYHPEQVNMYGCEVGDGTKIGSFVEIRRQVKIGRNVKIQAFAFIPEGITIEDGVFIGPHVCFTNDLYPKAVNEDGELLKPDEWEIVPTLVQRGANLGANSTIICGVTIGEFALIGAGAVVTRDVPPYAIVAGVPARVMGDVRDKVEK